MILALSTLCENPQRRTGLTSFFNEFVRHSLELDPDLTWVVFVDPNGAFISHDRVKVVRFHGNQHICRRLIDDHFRVPLAARAHNAAALVTIGFAPALKVLPVAMHMLVLTHLNQDSNLGWLRHSYRKWMTYSGLKRAELVFTNSFWAASKIKSVAPWCADKLVVSYEGLQHETFHSHADSNEQERLKVEFGFGSGFYLWVSNFYPYKQAELLLKAYSLLNPAFRATRPMVMVGGNWGAGAAEAKAVAEKLGISKDVRFLGWVKDGWLPALYRQCGAFCLASKEETFGRSVIEAMACGAPCVVNDIPIMREVTAGHAVITDFRDGAGAAQDLRRIIEDSDLRDRISADGISRAAEFDFRRAASERIAAIRQRLYAASRFDTRNKAPILIRCEGEEKNL